MSSPRAQWPAAIAFGGDYNPEQWSPDVWADDIRLMREAGVNLVTVGVFSWGWLEHADGVYDFGWLDTVIGMLAEAGIGVDLATPTASPPIWLHQEHPEILPMARDGRRYHQGGRLQWCPSSPVFREFALRIVRQLAERYGDNPAVRLWHVSNELGGGNRRCYCDESTLHFRRWLEARYGTVGALNDAWGTAFWGHRYGSFDEVTAPLDSESMQNPGLVLDFDRFSSDALLEHFIAERDTIRQYVAETPITTNFMVGQGPDVVDYARWAPQMDVLANDHYTLGADPLRESELAFGADRMRGMDRTKPWLLMEHSTSAVNWQPRNRSKSPGEMMRNSLQHIARGADGALFFQWRASTAGAEQFHSGMVPHGGERTRVWREVVELGAALAAISEVAGSLVESAKVALLYDDEAAWAWESGQKPHNQLRLTSIARGYYDALWKRGVLVDIVPPWASLDGYDLVIVPGLFLADDASAASVAAAAERGAVVLVTYLSGIVDETNRVRQGGYPGAFRELLGVFGEEFHALLDGEQVALDTGAAATIWTEHVHPDDAAVVARYASGPLSGEAAITRRDVGSGQAWYVSAGLDDPGLDALVGGLLDASGVVGAPSAPGLETVRRRGGDGSFLFLINHSDRGVVVDVHGTELISGAVADGALEVAAGAVAVVREAQ